MAIKVKTFKISSGGSGTEEVSRFISTTIGRDLTLIKSISGISLNPTTTEITLTYLDKPSVSIQHISPSNGFVASTGSPLETAYLAFSNPINRNGISAGDILLDGVAATNYEVLTGLSSYVISVLLSGEIDGGDVHSLIIDENIKDLNNRTQASTSVFGFTESDRAVLQAGYEESYTSKDLRGTAELKYSRIDASLSPTKKALEMLTNTSELLAFASVQKTTQTTELFLLVAKDTEPKVSSVFPRQGASNPQDESFDELILTFEEPINTRQVLTETGRFQIHVSFGTVEDIDPQYITVLNSKTISFNIPAITAAYSVNTAYINVFMTPGLRSGTGLASTKGYMFNHVSSNLASASQGPPGADGADGVDGADGTGIVWLGEYDGGVDYTVYDTVSYLGSSYIVTGETPSAGILPTDLDYWNVVASGGEDGTAGAPGADGTNGTDGADGIDGTSILWSGYWDSGITYFPDTAVGFESGSYICNTTALGWAHNPTGASNRWDLMAQSGGEGLQGIQGDPGPAGPAGGGIDWQGTYSAIVDYNSGEAVSYLGSSYLATGETPSAGIDPTNTTYWNPLAISGTAGTNGTNGTDGIDGTGINWQGDYDNSTDYDIDDAVSYQGSSYIATGDPTPGTAPTNGNFWDLIAGGVLWSGAWDSSVTYYRDNLVSFESGSYICTTIAAGWAHNPTGSSNRWDLIAQSGGPGNDGTDGTGFNWAGVFIDPDDLGTTYSFNDVVYWPADGAQYIWTGVSPANGSYPNQVPWELFYSGQPTDHGFLTGLLDNDHPQYFLGDGSVALSGDVDFSGYDIANITEINGVNFDTFYTDMTGHTGDTALHVEEYSKSIFVEGVTSSEDISMFHTNRALTFTEFVAIISGTSLTWSVLYSGDRTAEGTEVVTGGTTTTINTTGHSVTSFDNASVPANSFVWLETSAEDAATNFHLTVYFTYN